MNYALLLSGGVGKRAKTNLPKQYIKASGHMMTSYALKPLLNCNYIDKVYIVADNAWLKEIIYDAEKSGLNSKKIAGTAEPGANRQLSILNGMKAIINDIEKEKDASNSTVLVHDAARPFLAEKLIERCYKALPGNDGVMPVLPMKDTVYLSEDGKRITKLLERSKIFAGQAPELFNMDKYYKANIELLPEKILKINGASEVAMLAGMNIAMIDGDESNVKVTTQKDVEHFRMVFEK